MTTERKYVIVCNEHQAYPRGALLFWGSFTEDAEERCFGGYTVKFDRCEKYTKEEIESFRGTLKNEYPFFDEINPKTVEDFKKYDEVVCTLKDLEGLGFSLLNVVIRP